MHMTLMQEVTYATDWKQQQYMQPCWAGRLLK